jgi:hypothetical protein
MPARAPGAAVELITEPIPLARLREMAERTFGDMVKAVVDIERGIMAVDGELHSDEEELLLQNGSRQANLWGINIYPDAGAEDWIEFDSMINLRPSQDNRTRGVEDPDRRRRILEIVSRLVMR